MIDYHWWQPLMLLLLLQLHYQSDLLVLHLYFVTMVDLYEMTSQN
jgi:hypothetical protein